MLQKSWVSLASFQVLEKVRVTRETQLILVLTQSAYGIHLCARFWGSSYLCQICVPKQNSRCFSSRGILQTKSGEISALPCCSHTYTILLKIRSVCVFLFLLMLIFHRSTNSGGLHETPDISDRIQMKGTQGILECLINNGAEQREPASQRIWEGSKNFSLHTCVVSRYCEPIVHFLLKYSPASSLPLADKKPCCRPVLSKSFQGAGYNSECTPNLDLGRHS